MTSKQKKTVVFESPGRWDRFGIFWHLRVGDEVYVVEPFHAYHHDKGIRFFPPLLPSYVDELIRKGKVHLIKAHALDAKKIYFLAAEKAVDVLEKVFSYYREDHRELLKFMCKVCNASEAENAFKIHLCNHLAEFFSTNILLEKIREFFPSGPLLTKPRMNVASYLRYERLVKRSDVKIFLMRKMSFSQGVYKRGFLDNLKNNLTIQMKLFAQALGGMFPWKKSVGVKHKKSYGYGINVVSPSRQLRGHQRGPDFIIDFKRIFPKDVIYFSLMRLKPFQVKQLDRLPGEKLVVPKAGEFFSNFSQWCRLLGISLRKYFLNQSDEMDVACLVLFNYFLWSKISEAVEIKNLITHCDFGIPHVGRNIALHQKGVQTWYFTDSMNFTSNFIKDGQQNYHRHPFWVYLNVDHFVTWDQFLVDYFQSHPQSIKQYHIVGCLWSGCYAKERREAKKSEDKFVIAAFDTSYACNWITSYKEGIDFAKHLIRLADEFSDIMIVLKEKKDRSVHRRSDGVFGPQLLSLYQEMERHPRIRVFTNEKDLSDVMDSCNLVISFPFTSTTFEAISMNKPALWHDPRGYYRETPYGKYGVVTHSFEELRERVKELRKNPDTQFLDPESINIRYFDPYRDGKALERFRDLLITETKQEGKPLIQEALR